MADPKDTKKTEEKTKSPKGEPAAKPKAEPKPKAAEAKSAVKPKAETKAPAKPRAETRAKPKAGAKAPAKPKTAAKPKAGTKTTAEAKTPEAPAAPTVRASARYVRIAPRKARLVADQVRGLQIDDARSLLRFSTRSAARDVAKLLDSAAANAENNHDLVADDLKVSEITVNEGPTLKRYRPRALGRATPIHKRTSHISVALVPEED
jgi:ribosomal protein L22